MATEAAVLGTPSFFVSSLTAGVFDELEKNYGLMKTFTPDQEGVILQAVEGILKDPGIKNTWRAKRERFLEDKINVTDYFLETILKYAKN